MDNHLTCSTSLMIFSLIEPFFFSRVQPVANTTFLWRLAQKGFSSPEGSFVCKWRNERNCYCITCSRWVTNDRLYDDLNLLHIWLCMSYRRTYIQLSKTNSSEILKDIKDMFSMDEKQMSVLYPNNYPLAYTGTNINVHNSYISRFFY